MKPFLFEVAQKIKEHPQWDDLAIVFPNRRAALYFRKHLSSLLDRPAFSPKLITIEDFIAGFSNWKVPDKLELISRLYNVYQETIEVKDEREPFDRFYFWGEMLLRDFDEVDKYMMNAELLFKDLSHQKELDTSFDFLTDEQREFLKDFWGSFDENQTVYKKKFLHVWKSLYKIYKSFKEHLEADGLAFEGMLHRHVAESLAKTSPESLPAHTIIFCGFNALTKAEETLLSFYVQYGNAKVYWDIDAYYINNSIQEAGRFFREYQQHPVLSKTFPENVPSNFIQPAGNSSSKAERKIQLFGAAQPVGQTKIMAQVLQEQLRKGIDPEDTLIVLPDEKLLLPVLHGISGDVEKLNITMGFPLNTTPLFNLLELLIELQINSKTDHFHHREALAILGHPYVIAADPANSNAKRKEILKHNWVMIPASFLHTGVDLNRLIFINTESGTHSILEYLQAIVLSIGSSENLSDLDREYAFYFHTFLNRLEEIIGQDVQHTETRSKDAFKSFLRLFRQLIKSQKVPFSGEPLRGLQVMGVLETRNLDFKNVFILSLNEGSFPSFGNKGSYIPFNIRKAYGLPTVEHQDAMYAYLFYRVLQRADNVFLFYNSETDVLGQGEMSRYLQQLIYESGIEIEKYILHNPVHPNPVKAISITKDQRVFDQLARHCEGHKQVKELFPSALNDYLDCRLKFYFRHIARIKEADEIEEDLDARVLGNFLHQVMELFYKQIIENKKSNRIEAEDLDNHSKNVESIIDKVFIDAYYLDPSKPVVYDGQRLVVKEIVKKFVYRILLMDKNYAPFEIQALEQRGMTHTMRLEAEGNPVVILGGIIDRADRKDNTVRVIDYKTGRDKTDIKGTISDLFVRDGERNKAAFQTMLYALLYKSNSHSESVLIRPGLLNRVNLFDEDFKFGLKIGKEFVHDVSPLLPEFETKLKSTLEELYNPEVPFDQTQNTNVCKFCLYQSICYR